ncbi:hypothetical protein [Raoultella terrigena]|uniref:hypothetical protein n=1 Tax=Raoultella terrigena TaxID=577 RepID=UPI0030E07FF1
MSNQINPASRIDENGNTRDVNNAYEEGIYAAVIGLEVTDNPYSVDDSLNRKLWLKAFTGVKSGAIRSAQLREGAK